MKVVSIARMNLVRLLRDRSNLFPMLAVPVLFVFLVGTQFGGEQQPTVGVAGSGSVAGTLVEALEEDDAVTPERLSADDVRQRVGDGEVALGVVLPGGAADALAAGEALEVEVVTAPDGTGRSLRPLVLGSLGEQALVPGVTAKLEAEAAAPAAPEVRAEVEEAANALGRTAVTVSDPGGGEISSAGGQFDEGAAQQMVLMVFLFTLLSAIPMVQSRQLGITTRMSATPTATRTIVAGEAAGRWLIAMVQGAWILVATAVLFDVSWGSLPAAIVVLAVFGAVGAGAGMLLGSFLHDEGVVVAAAMLIGLASAALGGAMLPTELFSSTMQTISRAMPHSWALDALSAIRDGGGMGAVWSALAVLLAAAVVLLGLASWRLRLVLARA